MCQPAEKKLPITRTCHHAANRWGWGCPFAAALAGTLPTGGGRHALSSLCRRLLVGALVVIGRFRRTHSRRGVAAADTAPAPLILTATTNVSIVTTTITLRATAARSFRDARV
jgi:hypothetical protein